MKNEILPIGSVVLLKGGTKKVMICGYYSKNEKDNKVYDYNGCIFPEGFMENIFCLFDKKQIEEVYYRGLENDDFTKLISTFPNSISYNSKTKHNPDSDIEAVLDASIDSNKTSEPQSASDLLNNYIVDQPSD